jgi:hypothetical protein
VLQNGVYTACEPCKDDPRKPPLWQVKARRCSISMMPQLSFSASRSRLCAVHVGTRSDGQNARADFCSQVSLGASAEP